MHLFKKIREDIVVALDELVKAGVIPHLSFDAVTAEPPRDSTHGDVATNAAMVLAKPAKKNPRALAELIKEKLEKFDYITAAEIAGPGFINLKISGKILHKVIREVLKQGVNYGDSKIGSGEIINVEYVSANPTGPMHVGHARNAVFGDALARLLQKAGFAVTKEYYINDAGAQIIKLLDSALLRYREALAQKENSGEKIEIPEGLYPGEYLIPVGKNLAEKYGKKLTEMPAEEARAEIRDFTVNAMLEIIKSDLALLGIQHDVFTSEKKLNDENAVDEAFLLLQEKGLIYQGVLPPPRGKENEEWEQKELTLFRSSQFGDDSDRPMKKSDGSWTYIAPDIAYHYDKLKRGFTKMILILAVDHGGYQKRLQAAVAALSNSKAELSIQLYQLVNLLENGVPIKMSKRAGNFLTVRDLVEAVGKDAVRFIMLTRRHTEVLDFDFKKATEQSKDNPVFYVQYAHTRACSVLRKNAEEIPENDILNISENELALLTDESETALIKLIAEWPRIVESASVSYEPHRIAFYLHDLAAGFHGLWNKGTENNSLRFFIDNNMELSKARLALVKALKLTIASGLLLLGVEPVEEM